MLRDWIVSRCLNASILILDVQLAVLLIIFVLAILQSCKSLFFACCDRCWVVASRKPCRFLHEILVEVNCTLN